MKNQSTTTRIARAKVAIAGLFACMVLSVQVFAQPACNAHFMHHPMGNGSTVFIPAFNPMGTTFAWDFGDGATSADLAPNHTYAQSGTYYVCLTVTKTDSNSVVLCSANWCDSVHFTLPPPPPPPVCNAQFAHHSHQNGAVDFNPAMNPPGSTYAWNFGDNSTSTDHNANHTYAAAGTYYACLTVTDTDTSGNVLCSATWCDSVHVMSSPPPPPPVCNAHFNHHRGHGMSMYFNAAHNPHGTTYAWDFGDGTTGTTAAAAHTYTASGMYYACLTVTDSDTSGNVLCSATWCDSVFIAPPPVPCHPQFITHHHFGNNLTVDFAAMHNPPGTTYAWDFGDGSTSTARDTNYTYALPGTYYACLTVTNTDTAGVLVCSSTWCDSIRVDTNHLAHNSHSCSSHRTASGALESNLVNAIVNVYPNPVTDQSVLHIENATGNVTFRIFENTGRLVTTKENLTNGDFNLNRSELRSGIYFYQVSDDNGNMINGKMIVQ